MQIDRVAAYWWDMELDRGENRIFDRGNAANAAIERCRVVQKRPLRLSAYGIAGATGVHVETDAGMSAVKTSL
jgi:hypothetical protein